MNLQTGLKPDIADPKDYKLEKLGGVFSKPAELPKQSFRIASPLKIRDQGSDMTCTARAVTAMLEDTEKVELAEEWQWMQTAKLNGIDPALLNQEGTSLRSAFRVPVKTGALERKYSPCAFERDGVGKCTTPSNYSPVLAFNSLVHRQKTYFRADNRPGARDFFDSLVLSMWQTKKSAGFGLLFAPSWLGQTYIDTPSASGYGHAMRTLGYEILGDKEYIAVQQSAGEDVGDKGIQYFSRAAMNEGAQFGAFSFLDLPDAVVAELKHPTPLGTLRRWFLNLW